MVDPFEWPEDEPPLPPRPRPVCVPFGTRLPPPPPGTRHVRVPRLGVVIADDDLRERVERRFHWPMILLAVAVLPLLAIEVYQKPTGALATWVDVSFAIIWFAFLVEFVAKITLAESRFEYVRRNWLDLVVILLPVLRVFRLTALARTVRLLKLRGVAFKFARTAMTLFVSLEVADRALRRLGFERPDRAEQPEPATMTRAQLVDEVRALRDRAEAWQAWYETHRTYLEEVGVLTYALPSDVEVEAEVEVSVDGTLAGEAPVPIASSAD